MKRWNLFGRFEHNLVGSKKLQKRCETGVFSWKKYLNVSGNLFVFLLNKGHPKALEKSRTLLVHHSHMKKSRATHLGVIRDFLCTIKNEG